MTDLIDHDGFVSAVALSVIRQRCRIMLLLDVAERTGLAPLSAARLHSFAYLSDVLSPVWDIFPFRSAVYKSEGAPHYPELQTEIDRLVILGLIEVSNLRYVSRPNRGARIEGDYALSFASGDLTTLLSALGAGTPEEALDESDVKLHAYLLELAGALASVPNDALDAAARVDATYADPLVGKYNVVEFGTIGPDALDENLSVAAADRFNDFIPSESSLSAGDKLYLYAALLGRRLNAG